MKQEVSASCFFKTQALIASFGNLGGHEEFYVLISR